jgi:hypothetical protein
MQARHKQAKTPLRSKNSLISSDLRPLLMPKAVMAAWRSRLIRPLKRHSRPLSQREETQRDAVADAINQDQNRKSPAIISRAF